MPIFGQSSTSVRPTAVTGSGGFQPASGMQTAVQLTFSFEIASLRLTPSFKMGALQLKPTSKIVTMRLAPSQQPQPAMNLQVTFEIASVQPTSGGLGQVRLTPSQQQRPGVFSTLAFNIAGLQLLSGSESGPVQLTPSQQGQASVHVTGQFQIVTVEFSPSFEIASIVLNATSKSVSVQMPGAGPSAVEGAPVFEIASVQVGLGDIEFLQLVAPSGSRAVMVATDASTIRQPATIQAAPAVQQPVVQVSAVVVTATRSVDDLRPFFTVLADAGISSARALLPRLALNLSLPAFASVDQFVDRAVNGELAATLDVTDWTSSPIAEFDRCVFLALYRSGIVRPITVTMTTQQGRTLLQLTDPLTFFDPVLEGQELPMQRFDNAFDLVALQLPFDE